MRNIFLTLILAFFVPTHYVAAAVCGSLLNTHGPVEILRHQAAAKPTMLPAHADDALGCEDVIITKSGAGATIAISRGKFVVGADSRLEVAEYQRGRDEADVKALNLIYGRARFLVAKRSQRADSRFEVRTPSATVGVRGTDFFVDHDVQTHVSREATIEGRVEVTKLDTGESTMVGPGQEISVSNTGVPAHIEPISDELKTEVSVTSNPIAADPDFAKVEAGAEMPKPQEPKPPSPAEKTKTAESDNSTLDFDSETNNRLIVTVGPSAARIYHVHSQLDTDTRASQEVAVQYQRTSGEKAWIGRIGLSQAKDDGFDSQGVGNKLSMLTAEAGIRFHQDRWWSPYARVGLALPNDEVTINRQDIGYSSDTTYSSLGFVGTVGLDMMILPTRTFGFYGNAEAQAVESPFTLQTTTHSVSQTGSAPSYAGNNANPSLFVALKIAIGVIVQF